MMRLVGLLVASILGAVAAIYIPSRDASPVAATGGVLAIAVGEFHTCAVLPDSGVQCWGDNNYGQLGDGTTSRSTTPVDVCETGSGLGCAGGQRLTGIVDISAGFGHTCALTDDGEVMCWGINSSGQLGDGTTSQRHNPVRVCATGAGPDCKAGEPLGGVAQMDSGTGFNCALMEDTGIKCWGANQLGQLGIGTPILAGATVGGLSNYETHPVSVCGPSLVVGVEAYQAGGTPPPACVVLMGFTAVSAAVGHACALLESGEAQCWGTGNYGVLGNGSDDNATSPTDVCVPSPMKLSRQAAGGLAGVSCVPITGLVAINAEEQHTCAITDQGRAKCWGRNTNGQVGDGTKEDRFTPRDVCASGGGEDCGGGERLSGVTALAGGHGFQCALVDGGVRCWGRNYRGSLGNGTGVDQSPNPVAVSGLTEGASVLHSGSRNTHACAVAADASLRCWGNNFDGQLGNGSMDVDDHSVPEIVEGFAPKTGATPTNTPTLTSTRTSPTATSTPTPPPAGLTGDVDCNGMVNAIDAAYILQYIAGLLPSLPCSENADTNGDGNVNSIDSALILQYTAGLLSTLPP